MQEWKDKCSAIYESHLNIQQKLQSDLTVLLETMVASTTHNRVESIFRVDFLSQFFESIFQVNFSSDFSSYVFVLTCFDSSQHISFQPISTANHITDSRKTRL